MSTHVEGRCDSAQTGALDWKALHAIANCVEAVAELLTAAVV